MVSCPGPCLQNLGRESPFEQGKSRNAGWFPDQASWESGSRRRCLCGRRRGWYARRRHCGRLYGRRRWGCSFRNILDCSPLRESLDVWIGNEVRLA